MKEQKCGMHFKTWKLIFLMVGNKIRGKRKVFLENHCSVLSPSHERETDGTKKQSRKLRRNKFRGSVRDILGGLLQAFPHPHFFLARRDPNLFSCLPFTT